MAGPEIGFSGPAIPYLLANKASIAKKSGVGVSWPAVENRIRARRLEQVCHDGNYALPQKTPRPSNGRVNCRKLWFSSFRYRKKTYQSNSQQYY